MSNVVTKPAYVLVANNLELNPSLRYVYSSGNTHYYTHKSDKLYPFQIDSEGKYLPLSKVWVAFRHIPLTAWHLRSVIRRLKANVGFRYFAELYPSEAAIPERLQRLFAKHGLHYDCGVRTLTDGSAYRSNHRGLVSLEAWCEIRTQYRIDYGEYEDVPEGFPVKPGTGVHISTQDRDMLAFYPDHRHILRDVPLKIKPGRYLKRYFPGMSDDEIRTTSALIGGENYLTFHSDFHDMRDVYTELHEAGIVNSCMSEDEWPESEHPLRVYHNSDVELAVLRNPAGKALSRALYNKNTREFPMVYGNWEKMEVAMEAAGFIHGSLDGAKINYIEHPTYNGYLIMPYIDGHRPLDRSVYNSTSIRVDYETVIIDDNGDIQCDNTSGRVELRELYVCDCCEGRFEGDDLISVGRYGDSLVCEYCLSRNYTLVNHRHGDFYAHYSDLSDYIHAGDEYYYDERDANDAGYVWAEFDDEWIREDDAIELVGGYTASEDNIGTYVLEVVTSDDDYIYYAWDEAPTDELWYSVEEDKVYDFEPSDTDDSVLLANARRKNAECPRGIPYRLWNSLEVVDEPQEQIEFELQTQTPDAPDVQGVPRETSCGYYAA